MALIATPLLLGHLYMATIHPDTRSGLSGMTTGFVDKHWAEHHYPLWYREHFEDEGRHVSIDPHITPSFDKSTESDDNEKSSDLEFMKSG